MTSRQKIIIDTDPGEDDAIALLLAFASPDELEMLGVTVVAGNVELEKVTTNARKICELAGRTQVPVFAGSDRPLARVLHTSPEVHGENGLGGTDLPAPAMPLQPDHAVDWLVRTVMAEAPGTVTLCPLGPLTNVAKAIQAEPAVATRLKRIVLMGGAQAAGGNSTPCAEFNIFVDPHAADIVLGSGAEIVMFPLDVTHQVLTSNARMDKVKALGTRVATVAHQIMHFYRQHDEKKYGTDGGPLHDPCVIAWLLRPELFQGKRAHVAVETTSDLTMGQTVVDWYGVTGRPANALVLQQADADGFFALLTERLGRYRDS